MTTLKPEWTDAAAARPAGPWPPASAGWWQHLKPSRPTAWPALLAVLCASLLLFAFLQVVQSGVRKGEARNRALLAQADMVRQCERTADPTQRAICHAQLSSATSVDGAAPNWQDGARLEPVALVRR